MFELGVYLQVIRKLDQGQIAASVAQFPRKHAMRRRMFDILQHNDMTPWRSNDTQQATMFARGAPTLHAPLVPKRGFGDESSRIV